MRRQWTKPRPRMEHIPDCGLTRREKEAFNFFEVSSIPARVGKKRIFVPLIWLPHAKYINSFKTLHFFLTHSLVLKGWYFKIKHNA